MLSRIHRTVRIHTTSVNYRQILLRNTSGIAVSSRQLSYAVVNHKDAYETAMEGRHGAQLKLAFHERKVKPSPPIGFLLDEDEDYEFGVVEGFDEEENIVDGPSDDLTEAEIVSEQNYNDNGVDGDEDDDSDGDDQLLDKDGISEEVMYDNRGFPIICKTLERAYKAGAPAGGIFTILKMGGTQHKVCVDDVIISDKLKPISIWSVGAEIELDEKNVLLVGSPDKTCVGLPFVNGAKVKVRVEEITREPTVLVFKKRRRKNSRRKNGHRREITMIRVISIDFPESE